MVSYMERSVERFFNAEAQGSTGGSRLWRVEVNGWLLFFKINPRRHEGHIRLAFQKFAILDLAIEEVTSVKVLHERSEILEVCYRKASSSEVEFAEACYRISCHPKIHIEHASKAKPDRDGGTKFLFRSIASHAAGCEDAGNGRRG